MEGGGEDLLPPAFFPIPIDKPITQPWARLATASSPVWSVHWMSLREGRGEANPIPTPLGPAWAAPPPCRARRHEAPCLTGRWDRQRGGVQMTDPERAKKPPVI